jgi:predicted dehydrogenase
MVAQNQRFRADTQWLKGRIEAGLLGDVYAVHTRWVRRKSLCGDLWFRYKALSGGGPLIDLGVHVMDLALWLIGFPAPLRVSGSWGQYFCPGDTEDWAYGTVRLEGGAILTVEVAEQAYLEREKDQVEIRGTKAGVMIDGGTGTTIYTTSHGAPVDERPILDSDWMGSRLRELRHFAESAISGKPTIIPPEQSVQIMAIIDAIYRSGNSGKEVALGKI